jgi:hypothetical protein
MIHPYDTSGARPVHQTADEYQRDSAKAAAGCTTPLLGGRPHPHSLHPKAAPNRDGLDPDAQDPFTVATLVIDTLVRATDCATRTTPA